MVTGGSRDSRVWDRVSRRDCRYRGTRPSAPVYASEWVLLGHGGSGTTGEDEEGRREGEETN